MNFQKIRLSNRNAAAMSDEAAAFLYMTLGIDEMQL